MKALHLCSHLFYVGYTLMIYKKKTLLLYCCILFVKDIRLICNQEVSVNNLFVVHTLLHYFFIVGILSQVGSGPETGKLKEKPGHQMSFTQTASPE